jgi:hypothetical protein
MATKPLPSAEYLRQCFVYDPETGLLTWRTDRPREHFQTEEGKRRWTTQVAGKSAGSLNGHLYVSINRISYKVHRIVWKMVTGRDPAAEIDHRNAIKTDNRWHNLREATHSQNTWNRPRRKLRELPKGVYIQAKDGVPYGRYFIKVFREGRLYRFGPFDTPDEAHAAYLSLTKRLHGDFHHPD